MRTRGHRLASPRLESNRIESHEDSLESKEPREAATLRGARTESKAQGILQLPVSRSGRCADATRTIEPVQHDRRAGAPVRRVTGYPSDTSGCSRSDRPSRPCDARPTSCRSGISATASTLRTASADARSGETVRSGYRRAHPENSARAQAAKQRPAAPRSTLPRRGERKISWRDDA